MSREPKGKGGELLQILISRDFETGIIQHAVLDAAQPAHVRVKQVSRRKNAKVKIAVVVIIAI